MPITWRTVQGPNTAADLNAAVSAFRNAGEQSMAMHEERRNQEQAERDKNLRLAQKLGLDDDGLTAEDRNSLSDLDIDYGKLAEDITAQQNAESLRNYQGALGRQANESVRASQVNNTQAAADQRLDFMRAQTAALDEEIRRSEGEFGDAYLKDLTDHRTRMFMFTEWLSNKKGELTQAQTDHLMEGIRVSQGMNTPEAFRLHMAKLEAEVRGMDANTTNTNARTAQTQAQTEGIGIDNRYRAGHHEADINQKKANIIRTRIGARLDQLKEEKDEAWNAANIPFFKRAAELGIEGLELDVEGKGLSNEQAEANIEQTIANTDIAKGRYKLFKKSEGLRNDVTELQIEQMGLVNTNLKEEIKRDKTRWDNHLYDREVSQRTQLAIADLAGMEPAEQARVMANLRSEFKDVNYGVLNEWYSASEERRQSILDREIDRRQAEDRHRWAGYDYSPEARALRDEARRLEVELMREGKNMSVAERLEKEEELLYMRAIREEDLNNRAIIADANSQWDNKVANRMQPLIEDFEQTQQRIMDSPNMSNTDKLLAISDGESMLAETEARYREEQALPFEQAYRRRNPGVSSDVLNKTVFGEAVMTQKTTASRMAERRAEQRQKATENLTAMLDNASAGKDLTAFSRNPLTREVEILGPEASEANEMTLNEAVNAVYATSRQGERTFWTGTIGPFDALGRDAPENIPKKIQDDIKDVWKAVGKNRQIFQEVMADVQWDIEWGEDEVDGLPRRDEIEAVLQDYRIFAKQQSDTLKNPPKRNAPQTELMLQKWFESY